jgi:hypothetical protein
MEEDDAANWHEKTRKGYIRLVVFTSPSKSARARRARQNHYSCLT